MSSQFVVIGVSRSRESWFSEVAQWSTSGAAPLEFIKCLSAEEVVAVIGSGRRISALLADDRVGGVDRELIAAVTEAGGATIVVSEQVSRDWEGLGAAGVLASGFSRDDLVTALGRYATPVDRSTRRTARSRITEPAALGRLVGVCGAPGSGASTIAMAIAQGSADSTGTDHATVDTVALLDGSRSADAAMYHDVGDVIPGLVELVDLHRNDEPDPTEIRRLLYAIDERGYSLLLGLRRRRDLSTMRTRSVNAALAGVRRSFGTVVVDHDTDLDGEHETGSIDVEERHALSRRVAQTADLLVVVARPGLKGVHDLSRLIEQFVSFGVPQGRIVTVFNQMPKGPAARADAVRTLAELTMATPAESSGSSAVTAPIFVPPVRRLEDVHRSVTRLPRPITEPLVGRIRAHLAALEPRADAEPQQPEPLRAGELSCGIDDRIIAAEMDVRSDVA